MFTVLGQTQTNSHPLEQDQAASSESVFDVVTRIFSHGDALAKPIEMIDALQSMSIVWAVIFLIVGLICLFNGYRYYKTATVTLALVIGAFIGYALGKRIGAQWIVAGCFGAMLATISFPLMKYAVAALGGLTGAYVGANAWSAIAHLVNEPDTSEQIVRNYWVGALIGLILFGMLSFVLFKLTVIVLTSISGSTIAVLGVISLLLQIPLLQENVAAGLKAHASVIPLLVLVPAVIGLILQETNPESPAEKGKG